MAKDGAIVQSPELTINGKKHVGNLISINASVRSIDTKVSGFESHFDVSWDDIVNKSRFVPTEISFTTQEIDAAKRIKETSFIAGREIFLLPTSFRMVSEFEIPGYIYCLRDGSPCSDSSLTLDGTEYPLKNGVAEVTFKMPPSGMAVISFPDDSTGAVGYPFKGKMFWWDETNKNLSLQTLIPISRVIIDCYQKEKWLFSDAINSEGITNLPKRYELCDRIQASFDSGNPGKSFAVFTAKAERETVVIDPYYNRLTGKLGLFGNEHSYRFSRIYQRAFFFPLIHLYNGRAQEKLFYEKHSETMFLLWSGILFLVTAGIIFFTFSVFSKIRVVKDEDGELLTHSFNQQVLALAASSALLSLFAFGLLYLLKHMA